MGRQLRRRHDRRRRGRDHHQQPEGRRGARRWPPTWIGTIAPRGRAQLRRGGSARRVPVRQCGRSCATGPMPGRWRRAPTARSRARSASRRCPRAAPTARTPARSAAGSSRSRSTRKNPEAAADLVCYLTVPGGAEAARDRGLASTRRSPALYEDPEILQGRAVLRRARRRPSRTRWRGPSTVTGAKYNQVSTEFWNAVHATLSGKAEADAALASLDGELKRIKRSSGRLAPAAAGRRLAVTVRRRAGRRRAMRRRVVRGDWRADERARRPRLTPRSCDPRAAWLFLAPMLVVLALVAGWPLAAHDLARLHRREPRATFRRPQFVGFENYSPTTTANGPASWPTRLVARGLEHASGSPSSRSRSRPCSA